MQNTNIALTTATAIGASTKYAENQFQTRKNVTTQHDDALLLATFADIATKTASPTPSPTESSIGRLNQIPIVPNLNQRYSDIQPRPRTVSDTSINDRNSSNVIPSSLSPSKKRPLEIQPQKPGEVTVGTMRYKTILRKKFSWKNYPPLEKFLIANRDEYLRHSTLNYTVQQKQYNNHLTEQMIELAAQYGLIFDDNDFSFVTIRDRIRCYYKSYVQSLKKRGILLGYAARKAGLVSDNDIERSASTAGKIFLPKV